MTGRTSQQTFSRYFPANIHRQQGMALERLELHLTPPPHPDLNLAIILATLYDIHLAHLNPLLVQHLPQLALRQVALLVRQQQGRRRVAAVPLCLREEQRAEC